MLRAFNSACNPDHGRNLVTRRNEVARAIALAVVPACVLAASPGCSTSEPPSPPPNIVMIVLDTMRADFFSFHGYERETAPNIAALAAEGIVFDEAYSTSSWTAPATASLMTGVYPDRHGVTRGFLVQLREASEEAGEGRGAAPENIKLTRLNQSLPTLAETLQERGYTTFGLATNINIGPEIGFDRGFDRFERHEEWPAEAIHGVVTQWKGAIKAADPFFLYVHLNDVHKPYLRHDEWYEARGGVPEAEHYESEIHYMDRWIGNMLEALDLDDNTLIAIVSDHGEEFMERGAVGHHMSLFAEVNRIVMMFHGPGLGIEPGVQAAPVSGIDFAPTLLSFAGLEPDPKRVDGLSLRPMLLESDGASGTMDQLDGRVIVAHRRGANDFNMYAVIRDDWKFITSPRGNALFNLAVDPGELDNQAETSIERRDAMFEEVNRYRNRGMAADSEETGVKLEDDLLRKLEALGYVEGGE